MTEAGTLQVLPAAAAGDAARWAAVVGRDAGADGAFVYAVRSTGIYCRPSCAAKKPQRERVLFFRLPAEAEAAGFRACRRCRPEQPAPPAPQADLVREACRLLDEAAARAPTLAALAARLHVSPHYLQKSFTRLMGVSPRQYAAARRVRRLKAALRDGLGVARAQYAAGYGSSSRLYARAPEALGMTPGAYRRGGAGVRIAYAIVDSPLGRLLVAGTDRGICAICFGDADAALESALRAEFPAAELRADAAALAGWVEAILRHAQGEPVPLDLPLDVRATAFQWRVWEVVRAIPYGSTRSYSAIAAGIGRPAAARAVAQACAANPVALAIPCHRVVHGDGGLGGYRWGVERKRRLLDQERAALGSARRA